VENIKEVESVFEIIAEPNRRIPRAFISMGAAGWQRWNAEYAKQFGIEVPIWTPKAAG
jgi:hypothetical protein